MQELLTALKASADETRLRILLLLADGELTVSEIVDVLGQSQPRVSRHLKLLLAAGLVTRVQEATWVFYRLAADGLPRAVLNAILDKADRKSPVLEEDAAGLQRIRASRFAAAQTYFDANAEQWSEIRALYMAEDAVEAALKAMIGPQPLSLLLDVGTGTGRMLELFAPQAEAAIGVDANRDMLTLARAKLAQADTAHAQVRQGDMYALPVDENVADLVIIHQVLHYADDPGAVLREICRVMAPEGRLIVVDFAPHDQEQLRDRHQHRRLGFSAAEMAEFADAAGLHAASVQTIESEPLAVTLWSFALQSHSPLVEKANA